MKALRGLLGLMMACALALGLTIGSTTEQAVRYQPPQVSAVVAPEAAADGAGHSLVIYNTGSRNLWICKTWTHSTSTASYCGSASGVLHPGENSKTKYGWVDTDGARVDAGWSLRSPRIGTDPTIAGCRASTFWIKRAGKPWEGGKEKLYLWDCPAY